RSDRAVRAGLQPAAAAVRGDDAECARRAQRRLRSHPPVGVDRLPAGGLELRLAARPRRCNPPAVADAAPVRTDGARRAAAPPRTTAPRQPRARGWRGAVATPRSTPLP